MPAVSKWNRNGREMDEHSDDRPFSKTSWLERLTGTVLIVVLVALAWMIVVARRPELARLPDAQYEVLLMAGVLALALVLVSLVALLGSRRCTSRWKSRGETGREMSAEEG